MSRGVSQGNPRAGGMELLTLNATGSECGFLRWSVLETSCWKGPVVFSHSARSVWSIVQLTLEAQLHGIELDRHCAGHGDGRFGVSRVLWCVGNQVDYLDRR